MNSHIPQSSPDRIGAGELYEAHSGFVASFLARLGVRRDEVSDLVQEVFLIAHRKGGFLPGPAKPRTWLGAIAFRVASGQRRKRTLVLDMPNEPANNEDNPELTLQARQALDRVKACLDSLDLAHRAVFVLFELEALSGAEIAEALQIPIGSVYRRLHEARATFRETHRRLAGDTHD